MLINVRKLVLNKLLWLVRIKQNVYLDSNCYYIKNGNSIKEYHNTSKVNLFLMTRRKVDSFLLKYYVMQSIHISHDFTYVSYLIYP